MSGFSARYDRSQGAFHAGQGDQHVHQHFTTSKRPRLQTFRALPDDDVAWLRQRFVRPQNAFTAARDHLDRHHAVLLDGPPGSGRRTAARLLLSELAGHRAQLREVVPEDDKGRLFLEPEQVPESVGLLLDLSEARSTWEELHRRLPSYQVAVGRASSRLVVVLPSPPRELDRTLGRLSIRVERPAPRDVLTAHLVADGFPEAHLRTLPDEVNGFLDTSPAVRDVAALAGLVCDARKASPRAGALSWFTEAWLAVSHRPDEISDRLAKLSDGPARALLLTTSMLEGARPDALHDAWQVLLATVGSPDDERPTLEREDLFTRLKEFDAGPDETGRVRFRPLRYGASVRQYFWDHRPDLREAVGTWAEKVPGLPSLTADDRAVFVDNFLGQTVRTAGPGDVFRRAERWADRSDATLRKAAVQALGQVVTRVDDAGRSARVALYDWSRSADLSPGRAEVLVEVCADHLARTHPDQALVRLHHATRLRAAGPAAEHRLIGLARSERRLHRRMLDRIATRLERHYAGADLRLFIALTEPLALCDAVGTTHPLLAEKVVRDQLRVGWAVLIGRRPPSVWTRHADLWLSTASQVRISQRDHLLDVIVEACGPRARAQGHLFRLARAHGLGPPVLERLDAVQNIGRRPHR